MFLEPYNPWYGNELPPRNSAEVQDEILIFGEELVPKDPMARVLDEMYTEFMTRSNPVVGGAHRSMTRVRPLVFELMRIEPGKRRRAVRRPPFRNLVLASSLLDESTRNLSKSRADRAEEYATLAEWIAAQPWPEAQDKATSLHAQAFMAQGNASRSRSDWQKAELRFAAAFSILRDLPIDHAHIRLCQALSDFREDQGRYHEAHLLQLAEMRLQAVWWQSGTPSAHSVVHLAALALKQADPFRAMALLADLCQVDRNRSAFSMVELEVFFCMAICLAAVGLTTEARDLLDKTVSQRRQIEDLEKRLSYEWLECRIAVHLGEVESAIPRLEAIRRRMLKRGNLEKICISSIDLALGYARRGDAPQHLPRLLKDIIRHGEVRANLWAPGSMMWFQEALDHGYEPATAARQAIDIIRQKPGTLRSAG